MNMHRPSLATSIVLLAVVAIVGFLVASFAPPDQQQSQRETGPADRPLRAAATSELVQLGAALQDTRSKSRVAGEIGYFAETQNGEAGGNSNVDRKIIYNAHVELATDDFSAANERVLTLVRQFDGILADSTVSGTSGETRRGCWKVRVPVARFDEFVAKAKELGELISAKTASQDVSEEYFDVEARIRNKTKEEERLLTLLQERPGKLEDVIAIERELSRVREELERMQGRMRFLNDRTQLTTVQLAITEVHDFRPPQAAGLVTRIGRGFRDSLASLQSAGETAVIGMAMLAPWLAVTGVALAAGYPLARRLLRRAADPATGTP